LSQTEWLSVEQIAKELGLTEETIRTYIRSRQLTAYRVGNTYRIKREDLNKFLEKRKIPGEDEGK
jgi:excisionase family DNA binding protein